MNNVEVIWATFKNTESFLSTIKEASIHLEPGEREQIETTWAHSPVEVEACRPEDNPDMLEIRPMFFGETLDLTPAIVDFPKPVNGNRPKP